jgi:hypothetical protein
MPTTELLPPVQLDSDSFGEIMQLVEEILALNWPYFWTPLSVFTGWGITTLRRNALPYSLKTLRRQKLHSDRLKYGEQPRQNEDIIELFLV